MPRKRLLASEQAIPQPQEETPNPPTPQIDAATARFLSAFHLVDHEESDRVMKEYGGGIAASAVFALSEMGYPPALAERLFPIFTHGIALGVLVGMHLSDR